MLYFANNGGVLEYDGVSWRLMRMPNNSVVKSLCMDESGKIFVGAQNELGYLAPDSTGLISYYSLTEQIPDSNRNFDNVGKTLSTNKGIYFQTDHFLFLWNGTAMKIWKPEADFVIFLVNNKLFLHERK